MFKNVIVKRPCSKITEGITSAPELGKPDYELALKQHDAYIEALKSCGVEVTVLDADENFPDSCFVEDTAVLTRKCAIITNPGAASRNKEVEAMIPVIKQFYNEDCIEYIKAPGTLEGGPEDEAYAANCIWMNGKVIVPDHFPKVAQIVRDAGYEVILVDTSEYRKIDGGLSCLSLRFTAQK